MTARTTNRHLVLALLAGGTLIVAGCSSSPAANPEPPTSVVAPGESIPFNAANNARADVSTMHPCRQTAGGWVLDGTVKNPASVDRKFQIVVDFVSRSGSTVLATTVVNVPAVAPGASASWAVTGAKGKPDVNCVVREAQSS